MWVALVAIVIKAFAILSPALEERPHVLLGRESLDAGAILHEDFKNFIAVAVHSEENPIVIRKIGNTIHRSAIRLGNRHKIAAFRRYGIHIEYPGTIAGYQDFGFIWRKTICKSVFITHKLLYGISFYLGNFFSFLIFVVFASNKEKDRRKN